MVSSRRQSGLGRTGGTVPGLRNMRPRKRGLHWEGNSRQGQRFPGAVSPMVHHGVYALFRQRGSVEGYMEGRGPHVLDLSGRFKLEGNGAPITDCDFRGSRVPDLTFKVHHAAHEHATGQGEVSFHSGCYRLHKHSEGWAIGLLIVDLDSHSTFVSPSHDREGQTGRRTGVEGV